MTTRLISVVRGNRPINYLDDEGRPIPSVVCYERQQKIVGREAKERLAQAGLGIQGNIVRSPKSLLGKDSVFIEGTERSPVDIVAEVVSHVLHQAKAGRRGQDLSDISSATVTIPVNMMGYRRRAPRDAFRAAGLSIVQFVHEPLAALYGYFRSQDIRQMLRRYDRKLILIFDWGGGTLDLTLCRLMDNMAVQLMNDGTDEVGGDVFDESVMNRLIQLVYASRGADSAIEIQPGAKARLLDRCERAKIDLSTRDRAQIYVRSFFRGVEDEDFEWLLNREEFEEVVAPLLDKGFKRIEMILENAGYTPEQVALCVATGGMSNMPAVQRRLHEWFGPERVRISDETSTLIAEGAAWIASDQANLQLAKNVELIMARNSYLPIVKARTAMPKEGEVQKETFHLYCTDPRDGVAKFQICAPKRPDREALPGEPRTHLDNLTVKVDQTARPFYERLELDIQINDDLILEAHARSLMEKDQDRREIHNLEFGLAFPAPQQADDDPEDSGNAEIASSEQTSLNRQDRNGHRRLENRFAHTEQASKGALSIRANIADRIDESLVPGELVYEYNWHYFDTRYTSPPAHQVHEKLYYQPCAGCGRASNDPLCKC